jgi:hypothetical protein
MPTPILLPPNFDVQRRPSRVHYQRNEHGFLLRMKQFSLNGTFFFLLFFTIIWDGAYLLLLSSVLRSLFSSSSSFDWFLLIFVFTHGIPAYFLSKYLLHSVFSRLTIRIDKSHLSVTKGIFGKGRPLQRLPLGNIRGVRLYDESQQPIIRAAQFSTANYLIIEHIEATEPLKLGEQLPLERLLYLYGSVQLILQEAKQDPFFMTDDLSEHLIE